MPAIICKCDQKIGYGAIPNPDEWLVISDTTFDGFSGQVDADAIYRAAASMLRCPRCGRVWVFWDGFDSDPTEYVLGPQRLSSE
jgi:hypothetical protein